MRIELERKKIMGTVINLIINFIRVEETTLEVQN